MLAASLALGVAACGSDDSSASGSERRLVEQLRAVGGTHQRRRRDVPAARLPGVGGAASRSKQGLTVNYQGIGSGGGIAQFTAGTVDFGAHRLGDEPTTSSRRPRRRATRSTSRRVFGAVTVSYNVQGVEKGLKLDGATIADIFLGKITKWNDPAIAKLNPGAKLPEHRHHGLPPLRRVGHDEAFTTFLAAYSHGVEERPRRRQDGQVADRHRRQGQRRRRRLRSSRPTARSATSSRPTRWQNNFTYASRQEQVRQLRRADARVDLGGRRRASRSPTTCASARSTRRAPTAYPIASRDVPARLPGHVQGRA